MGVEVERRFVRIPGATIHCAIAGDGEPVLLLHQTPRSWDEYRDVLPVLAGRRRAIAMDIPGFGDSTRLPVEEESIECWADAVAELLEALGLGPAVVVGHHTGAYVAAELGVARPERVRAVVLSSLHLATREEREAQLRSPPPVDHVERRDDGSHLADLWSQRAPFYPADAALLDRYVIDCLKAGELAAEGHRIVARYAADERVPLLACPVLLIGATEDPHAFPDLDRLRAALPHAEVAIIQGGMVPLPDQLPDHFAAALEAFLDELPD